MKDRAREILRTLVEEVKNPDIANGPAAVRAAMDAEKLFKEEDDALQKRGPKAEVPRAGGQGGDEPPGTEPVGEGNLQGKAARTGTRRAPRAKASEKKALAN